MLVALAADEDDPESLMEQLKLIMAKLAERNSAASAPRKTEEEWSGSQFTSASPYDEIKERLRKMREDLKSGLANS